MNWWRVTDDFLNADMGTLVRVLFWGNLSFSFFILAYMRSLGETNERRDTGLLFLAKFLQSVAWCCLLLITRLPHIVVVHLGQTFLYVGLFLESLILLSMSKYRSRRLVLIQGIILAAVVIGFNLTNHDFLDIRIQAFFGAYSVFLILVIPGIAFILSSSGSLLRKMIGGVYIAVFAYSLVQSATMLYSFAGYRFSSFLLQDRSLLLFVIHMYIGSVGFLILLKEDADKRIAELAYRDPLTGLYNRRYFMEQARLIFSSHARFGEEVSVLFLDIDHFKSVNDTYGHHFGDAVLHDFASVLKLLVRTCDLVCRYGGEEFVLLLPKTDRDGASVVGSRIRQCLCESRFPLNPSFSYTVSIGVAHRVPKSGSVDALQRMIIDSDAALYRAKDNGRDRIEFFEDIPESPV